MSVPQDKWPTYAHLSNFIQRLFLENKRSGSLAGYNVKIDEDSLLVTVDFNGQDTPVTRFNNACEAISGFTCPAHKDTFMSQVFLIIYRYYAEKIKGTKKPYRFVGAFARFSYNPCGEFKLTGSKPIYFVTLSMVVAFLGVLGEDVSLVVDAD